MYKILVIEDDELISSLIQENLNKWNYQAYGINDFSNVLNEFKAVSPDLVLLDINLPFFNGYYWCNEIRKLSNVPIIFISSASDNMNIVMAMNMGGDDFLAKPFDLNVLVAKVNAVIRRSYELKNNLNILEYKGVVLNINEATLSFDKHKIDLTKNEYKIMTLLFEKADKIVSRNEIMEACWHTDEFIDDNTLSVNIARLKRKLEDIGLTDFIKTKKGIGYFI